LGAFKRTKVTSQPTHSEGRALWPPTLFERIGFTAAYWLVLRNIRIMIGF
jgi:hypothetical protein